MFKVQIYLTIINKSFNTQIKYNSTPIILNIFKQQIIPVKTEKLKKLKKNNFFFNNNWYLNATEKTNKNIFAKINIFITKMYFLKLKINFMWTSYLEFENNFRFRYKITKTLFFILFFDNTITLKNFFFFWIKYKPLKTHKKILRALIRGLMFFQFMSQIFNVQFKVLLWLKGKLGLTGDKKKKKFFYSSTPKYKKINECGLCYDGIGSASKFGLTFLKIGYTTSNFNSIENYKYF